MRRFLIAWKLLGYARRFQASIVNYADDFVVLGKADGTAMPGSGGDHNATAETPDQRKEDPMPSGAPKNRLSSLGTGLGATFARAAEDPI